MPAFSNRSKERLDTCHPDLQTLFNEVIKTYDCTIIEGARDRERQQELFRQGLSRKDGIEKKSKHQTNVYNPYSQAVDVAPWHIKSPHIDWNCEENFYLFSGYVLAVAENLLQKGAILHKIRWGGSWDGSRDVRTNKFNDLVHFELLETNE